MGSITTLPAYKTTDGQLWDDRNDATKHQQHLDACSAFSKATNHNGSVMLDDVYELRGWLTKNSEWVLPLMGWQQIGSKK